MTPEQKQLVEDFTEEALSILNGVRELLDQLESGDADPEGFATVAQRIDGIMGCAKTLGLSEFPQLVGALTVVSNLSEGCKQLGYKAAQIKNDMVIPIVAGFLAEAAEMIEAAIVTLRKGYMSHDEKAAKTIRERLLWVSGRMNLSEKDQAEILARFGL